MDLGKPGVKVMRGVPGSGKTFLARKMMYEWTNVAGSRVSADDYFEEIGYFDSLQLTAAHGSCFFRFMERLRGLRPGANLIVDNTNLFAWEASPYVLAATAYGVHVEVIEVSCDARVAFARQTHGVPEHAHDRMCAAFVNETLPRHWTVRKVVNT